MRRSGRFWGVMAQRRSVEAAFGYVLALAPGAKANCWAIAEEAGHEGPHRMQALPGSCIWDWKDLRGELPSLAAAWLPCNPGDLTGPGIAIEETAQIKHADATACAAPQHAGCTGKVENCVTTVFSACVTTSGQAGRTSTSTCQPGGRRIRGGAVPPGSRATSRWRPNRSWRSPLCGV